MQDKLQELTDKLYQEGLSKGKAEGDRLLEAARKEADQIIAAAKVSARQITEDAKKAAAEAKANADGDITLAVRQTMATVKQQLENLITAKSVGAPATAAMSDTGFLQAIIKTAIERFNPNAATMQLEVLLPAEQQQALQAFVTAQVQQQLSAGVEFRFDRGIKAGFKIGPASGGYHISLTDSDFENLFAASLRPHVRTLLFGK